jgi:hypothetical protein
LGLRKFARPGTVDILLRRYFASDLITMREFIRLGSCELVRHSGGVGRGPGLGGGTGLGQPAARPPWFTCSLDAPLAGLSDMAAVF